MAWFIAGAVLLIILSAKAGSGAGVGLEVPDTPAPVTPAPLPDIVTMSGTDAMVNTAAARYGQDPLLMKAVIRQESNFNPAAVNPADPSYGLAQIMPFWVSYFGLVQPGDVSGAVNLLMNPRANIEIEAQIFKYFRGRGFQFPRDIDVYNVGETLWAKGVRNQTYRQRVTDFYRSYGGIA